MILSSHLYAGQSLLAQRGEMDEKFCQDVDAHLSSECIWHLQSKSAMCTNPPTVKWSR